MPVKIKKEKVNLSKVANDLVGYVVTNEKGQNGIIIEQLEDYVLVQAFDSQNITGKELDLAEQLKIKYDAEEVTIYIRPKFEPEYDLYVVDCAAKEDGEY